MSATAKKKAPASRAQAAPMGEPAAAKTPVAKTRSGARRTSEVPDEVRRALNQGVLETKNLMEALVIDFDVLLAHTIEAPQRLGQEGVVKRMREAGLQLPDWQSFKAHPSDTVRGWACYRLAATPMTLPARLDAFHGFATDTHFGVREWAWMAARPALVKELDEALVLLAKWSLSGDPNARRFACESLRPRGVWCAHIDQLKNAPELALPLLEPLRSDPSKYVRDSVANWLNDASKTQPAWVRDTTRRWLKASPTRETQALVARATRSL